MMGIIELFFLGLGLSMDAAAISISNTLAYPHLKWKAKLSMPVLFALFQGIMPILGYYASGIFATFIDTYAGFVAFFILCFIGGKMIIDVVYQTDEAVSIPQYTWRQGCIQAIATSLDAMAVGVGLAFLQVNIIATALAIGCATLIMSTLGMMVGRFIGSIIGKKAEILGGLVLIGIGVQILWTHFHG